MVTRRRTKPRKSKAGNTNTTAGGSYEEFAHNQAVLAAQAKDQAEAAKVAQIAEGSESGLDLLPVTGLFHIVVHDFLSALPFPSPHGDSSHETILLDDRRIVEIALGFANNDPAQTPLGALLLGIPMPPVILHKTQVDAEPDAGRTELELLDSVQPELRPAFTKTLVQIVAEPDSLPRYLTPIVSNLQNRIAIVPHFHIFEGALKVRYRVMPVDIRTALYYAVSLILDPMRPFHGNLCRCKLDDCMKFFLAIKPATGTGRIRREYCSQEHMQTANNRRNAERVARSRARAKKEANTKAATKPRAGSSATRK